MELKKSLIVTASLLAVGSLAQGATTLVDNDFEGGTLQDWIATGSDAGLYENGDIVSNMGAGDALIDYAPNGEFSLWDGRGGSTIDLAGTLALDAQGYTQLTIAFTYNFRNGSGTRRLRTSYSDDNGATWEELGFVTGNGSQIYTLDEGVGSGEFEFTDLAKFRFAFGDSGGAAGPAFIDNVVIQGTPDFIPEPSAVLLGGLGLLGLIRRRR